MQAPRPYGVLMIRVLPVLFCLLLFMPLAANAHHGFTGRYDLSAPIWLEGIVTQAYFGRPHATLTLRTASDMALPARRPDPADAKDTIAIDRLSIREDTSGREIVIEFPPISQFFNLGRSIGPGSKVSVIAFRNCDAPHQLRGQWILADKAGAQPVTRPGRLSYQVERC